MMITCICGTLGGWLAGKVVDFFGYRYIYVWDFVFTLIASVFLVLVYLGFRMKKFEQKAPEAVKE
jgi:MFS family permease